jgi:hypothetical protein
MNMEKLIELAERRATLVARAAAQREELSKVLMTWRKPLERAHQGLDTARRIWSHPELFAGIIALLTVLRAWRITKWLPPGWIIWRIARAILGSRQFIPGL